ncbi:helix-turn-helix domain-containing protein [Devosia sp. 63-57]
MAFHYVRAALAAEGGCISATARRLGIHRRTLQRMLGKARPKPKVRAVL